MSKRGSQHWWLVNSRLIRLSCALLWVASFEKLYADQKADQLACCAIANLLEAASNMSLVVNHGCIPLLINALDSQSDLVQREAARAIGNLAGKSKVGSWTMIGLLFC